ncbi:hypothetical protein [Vibrio sagamiensis]|uniref:Uncharacterized protein n=1 Tax=Vibrio sagamiensis NBRC 104589 TaxID=1219064 RepID=A0A511QF46_9VIBR|nr:hypothetical protein [Vibrio sagamiensis]PNQ59891.1 hypothetical protein C1141_12160 [Vibrio agarivorans]GEM75082.1 hypothetical protein VSA01S_11940 [Vibrio sagamiensis NBRC 104589]
MDAHRSTDAETILRNAAIVMDPNRLGAMHQTRISFARSLIRKIASHAWQFSLTEWQLCPRGFGHVIYRIVTPENKYHFVAFCTEIEDEERNDRVIANKWDVTFALVQGEVDAELLRQLSENIPLQEAGRNSNTVLVLARANKSVRVFEHIIKALSEGTQPQAHELIEVGYILRTTAVYGNGKFGIADFNRLENNPDFYQSFSAQMCAVYLLRSFSLDWVHYLARQKGNNNAVTLNRELQRYLGVGNATGLGMAPFLIHHPCIVDQWMTTRETAIAEVLALDCGIQQGKSLERFLFKAVRHLEQIVTINDYQQQLNQQAIEDVRQLINCVSWFIVNQKTWSDLVAHSRSFGLESQEILLSCLIELYPCMVDSLSEQMNTNESFSLSSGLAVKDLMTAIEEKYQWAIKEDYSLPESCYWFWYRSKDKEEPRLGVRGQEKGEENELPLDIGRQVNCLYDSLQQHSLTMSLAEFLLLYPQYRTIARRVWTLCQRKMGDVQMNVIHQETLPIHLLRCKLSMLGATKFDPRSDRWVRVTFFQGAPLIDEINDPSYTDTWLFPIIESGIVHEKTSVEGGVS